MMLKSIATVKLATRAFSTAPQRILVTGSTGQIGVELVPLLQSRYGADNVVATDIKVPPASIREGAKFNYLDVQDADALHRLVVENDITTIVHLASLLSAVGERNPQLAMKVNANGSANVLEVAAAHKLKVFIPSTIAVFGKTTPELDTPNETVMRPGTMYGITKVYTELLGEYYFNRYGVDFRSIRYPGIISNKALPGGGTTDYAVEIYYEALKNKKFTCCLGENTDLPMLYMPDCLNGTLKFLETPSEKLTRRVYNMTGMSFSPAQIAAAVKKEIPDFEMSYNPDFREAIARSWPRSIDDSAARKDWGWSHEYNLEKMTKDMLDTLRPQLLK